ncbi:MAG: PKD domain-containing protein [Ferruginibacter sp.]
MGLSSAAGCLTLSSLPMHFFYQKKQLFRFFILLFLSTATGNIVQAQCFPNIDFESGDFTGWKCFTGRADSAINWIQTLPIYGRHTMLSTFPGNGMDPYGGFPQNCPDGSGHSVKLGNAEADHQAEKITYTFTIPPAQNNFILTYYYAMVLQDSTAHANRSKSKFTAEVLDMSTGGSLVYCASFSLNSGVNLPGMQVMINSEAGNEVRYKDWSAVSVDLSGKAGKTFELSFFTQDCNHPRPVEPDGLEHFGYAYVDVSTNCSNTFPGAAYCPLDTAVYITGPWGFQTYKWYNSNFTQLLGTQQILHLNPPPPANTQVAVVVTPFLHSGCIDTFYANLRDTLTVNADAGRDTFVCNNGHLRIGGLPKEGIIYKWEPAIGLSNTNVSSPFAFPLVDTRYILTATSIAGGCEAKDTILVKSLFIDNWIHLAGAEVNCITAANNYPVLSTNPALGIQWFKDNIAISGATQPNYTATQTGLYFAQVTGSNGCSLPTPSKAVGVFPQPIASFTVNNPDQCFNGQNFIFTGTTAVMNGTLDYKWDLGDGKSATTANVIHAYANPGIYKVKMLVSSTGGWCSDSIIKTINVYATPVPEFKVQPICVNLQLPLSNQTVNISNSTPNYLWDFGNGQTSILYNPVQTYSIPGTYTIKLSVSTIQCPSFVNIKQQDVVIDAARPGVTYAIRNAILNFPEKLQARNFGGSVLWNPSINLDNPKIYTPDFRGFTDQQYTITLKTQSNCLTVDTQLVRTYKKIGIYVPNVFRPNSGGPNELLRPLLMSFKEVHYFRIYNRWGHMLFEMKNDRPGWDGTVKGIPQEMQTVIWMLEAVDVDGIVHRDRGTTILMR